MPAAQPQDVAAATDNEVDPLLHREGTSRNGWQPTADALLTHGRSKATGRSRWQRISLVFADSTPRRFAADCHRLQPRGSIKAPYSARHENDFVCATLGGISLSEKRQLNGYRVRLRVVEEYDVALLAESHDDAKVRAEADLRRGDQFEDIQDSWPEEIVSVEALAVEPYPELE